jgi:deoxyribose-phosphate aldolase
MADQFLAEARKAEATPAVAKRAIGLLDLTSLNDDDTPATIARLCLRAQTPAGPVAAVCVWPRFVAQARAALRDVRVATVVNFPDGQADAAAVRAETLAALDAGADEIDVVLPYRAYLAGERAVALRVLEAVVDAATRQARVKAILETGALKEPAVILQASRDAIARGADFLKTSTGKIPVSATLEACLPMLQAIREHAGRGSHPVGLKPSGGIRTTAEAAGYLALADALMGTDWATPATFRFGASSLLDALLATLGHASEGRRG